MAAGEDVGVLVARLVADTQGLQRDMTRAQQTLARNSAKMNRSLSRIQSSTRSVARAFRSFRTLVAGAAVVMGVRLVKAQLDAAAAILDTSEAIGVQAESLQVLRFAAKESGLAVNTIEMGLQRFSRRVAEARTGSGELADTLAKYNIAVTDSSGRMRSNEAILRDFADALRNADSEQERLRIAFKAFDSEGARPMIQLLGKGSDALDDYTRRAEELGIVVDRDILEKGREAQKAWNVMATTLRTKLLVAVSENADTFMNLAEAGVDALTSIAGWLDEVIQKTGFWLTVLDNVLLAMGGLKGVGVPGVGGRDVPHGTMGVGPESPAGASGSAPAGATGGVFGAGAGTGTPSVGGGVTPGGGTGQGVIEEMTVSARIYELTVFDSLEKVDARMRESGQLLVDIARDSAQRRAEIERQAQQRIMSARSATLDASVGFLGALGAAQDVSTKKGFERDKKMRKAQAVIDTARGVSRALADHPAPYSFAVAALVAARGLAQVSAINSASFGGGGGGGAGGGPGVMPRIGSGSTAGSTGAGGLPTVTQRGASDQRVTQLIFQGPIMGGRETARLIVDMVRQELDRDVILIDANTRQAAEIRRGMRG